MYHNFEVRVDIHRVSLNLNREDLKNSIGRTLETWNKPKEKTEKPLISAIQRFFPYEIINDVKGKIVSDLISNRIVEFLPQRKVKSNQIVLKTILKMTQLSPDIRWNAAEISRAIRVPYSMVRKSLRVLKENNTETDFKLHFQMRNIFNLEDIKLFLGRFSEFQRRHLTIDQMHQDMKKESPKFEFLSRTAFYRCFIRAQRLVFRLPRIRHALFNEEKKKETRLFTTFLIYSTMSSFSLLLFYDETTIQITKSSFKSWFSHGQKNWKKRASNSHLSKTKCCLLIG